MKIQDDVLAVLSTLEIGAPEGPMDAVRVRITEQLERNLYTKVDKVLKALGGAWTTKVKAHVFPCDAAEKIELAITTGEVATARDIGWFPTPAPLARQLVEMADVGTMDHVLEPSAGEGAIVQALLDRGVRMVSASEYNADRAHELSRKARTIQRWAKVQVYCEDFLACRRSGLDRVVMNPPFCLSGIGDHLDHVRHAFGMLRPGGVLVSVLPSSITFRRDRRHAETRAWILEHGTIAPLPEGSFKASGTGVNTCVVRLVKPS